MSARVHAIVVVRPDGRAPAAAHLKQTLTALAEQTRACDRLTIVRCGDDPVLADRVAQADADQVIELPGSTSYAAAVRAATADVTGDHAVWLLAQDTAPEQDALASLLSRLDSAPTLAAVAPKLVRADDRTRIVSLGVTLTRWGRTVTIAEDEFDQGQHDGTEDVLGADVRGLLVRASAWTHIGGLDPALHGADEGLDLGIRARLAGHRITAAPHARVAVEGDAVAGPPPRDDRRRSARRALVTRTAQLHRRLVYAPLVAAPLHWLSLLPLAVLRTVLCLVTKTPSRILPEWGASALALAQLRAVVRARRRIARTRTTSWSTLAPLRASRSDLNARIGADDREPEGALRSDLRFFAGGGAWVVLGALVVSVASFTALLAWPTISGGALLPMRESVGLLWQDAAYGLRAGGLDIVGPADPFAAIVAIVGSLWPVHPPTTIVVLWIAALPLAALGGWVAATRITERSSLRIVSGVAWALAPSLLTALVDPRPAAVLAHLLLPWLFYSGSVAHRSWGASGAASILLAAVLACAPSLAPALAVAWVAALVLVIAARHGHGVLRVVWTVVPSAIVFAPLIWHQMSSGDAWALLADPGAVWAGESVGADALGRAVLATGFPTPELAGWTDLLAGAPTWWVPLLLAPLGVLAVLAPLSGRRIAGIVLLLIGVVGTGTAFAQAGVAVAFASAEAVPVWTGSGLSLAFLGALGAALTTLDTGLAPRPGMLRPAAAALLTLGMLVVAVPSVTAMARGDALVTVGPRSTLPAYVAAIGRDEPDIGTLVLTPLDEGGVSADVVWGASETLGSQATILTTRTEPLPQDADIARITADLVAGGSADPVARLREEGVSFVLLSAPSAQPTARAEAMLLSASAAIDQRDGLVAVGDTDRGALWRVTEDAEARDGLTAQEQTAAAAIVAAQVMVLAIALLLAAPTAVSRRAARHRPRVVGIPRRKDHP